MSASGQGAELQHHRLGLTWVERTGLMRTSHALRSEDRVWLIDPFDDSAALAAAQELGTPAAVIQLLDRHNRDCIAIAGRLGVPMHRLPDSVPGAPFEMIPLVTGRFWIELALWWEAERALVVTEAIGTTPMFALGRSAGIHPLLRLRPPRAALTAHRPEMLLVGHGPALESGGADAIDDALAHARGDLPKLLLSLPKLGRRG